MPPTGPPAKPSPRYADKQTPPPASHKNKSPKNRSRSTPNAYQNDPRPTQTHAPHYANSSPATHPSPQSSASPPHPPAASHPATTTPPASAARDQQVW